LAEFRLHTSHHWNEVLSGAEMPEQKLTARSPRKRKLRGCVDCSEVIEMLVT
jgi:hypothetical protein